ncbi:MAG TPA: DUF4097 family beta strand repeat-containing protein [Terriglobales bacterium]|nr:DUF4097 family beta strand repeat-containing protein [Terriglobales bacterium]
MILELAAATLLALSASGGHTDTVVTVRPGARLDLNDFSGRIMITAWDRGAIRVTADHDAETRLAVDAGPVTVMIHALRRIRIPEMSELGELRQRTIETPMPASVDYQLTVPRWMDLRLSGVNTDMTLKGVEGQVDAQTVRGTVALVGGRRFVRLCAIDGDVDVEGARGHVEISSVNQDVDARAIEGPIKVSTVNGGIRLTRIASDDVEASTVNGPIIYAGTLGEDGRYRFSTHMGDLTVMVPEATSAAVSVSTYNGGFESSFPVRVEGLRRGKRFEFVLGTGRGELDLESFSGSIRLLRPGEKLPGAERAPRNRPAREIERHEER